MDNYYEQKVETGLLQRSGPAKFHLPEECDQEQAAPNDPWPKCQWDQKPLKGRQRRACSAACRKQLSRHGKSVLRAVYEGRGG